MQPRLNSSSLLALLCLCPILLFSGCNRAPSQSGAQSAAKRYAFKGTIVSVDKQSGTANINNEPIAGFMDAMLMSYSIKPASTLDQLQPGDSITADVVVESDKYWLENVKVTAHATPPAGKPAASVLVLSAAKAC